MQQQLNLWLSGKVGKWEPLMTSDGRRRSGSRAGGRRTLLHKRRLADGTTVLQVRIDLRRQKSSWDERQRGDPLSREPFLSTRVKLFIPLPHLVSPHTCSIYHSLHSAPPVRCLCAAERHGCVRVDRFLEADEGFRGRFSVPPRIKSK